MMVMMTASTAVAEGFQACGTHLAWRVRCGLLVFHEPLLPSQ